jgi:glucose/arabinose dehydrogenase
MLIWVGLLFITAGCATQSPFAPIPTPTLEAPEFLLGPPPPMKPEGVGAGLGDPRPIENMLDAFACLTDGQPAYALLQSNASVLTEPSADGCTVGRAASGSLVRIEGIYRNGDLAPLATLDRRQKLAALDAELSLLPQVIADPVGYAEDIQPLFERTCASCHGSAVQTLNLKVTDYDALLAGSLRGEVVVPGDPESSKLWTQIATGAMPLIGELAPEQKRLVHDWIAAGAPRTRPAAPATDSLWLQISSVDFTATNNNCTVTNAEPHSFIRAGAAKLASCVAAPTAAQLAQLRPAARPNTQTASLQSDVAPADASSAPAADSAAGAEITQSAAPPPVQAAAPAPRPAARSGSLGIQAAPLGISAPSDSDPWMIGRGGFCVEQRLQTKLENNNGITSLAFAPDGRLFIALDSPSSGEIDPNILFDAFHPSRSIVVYNSAGGDDIINSILQESGRITGLTWHNGSLYISRAGEVGRIPDGGGYERLAAGFAVNGRLFHANNGIAVSGGWLYISAGGVLDGFSDGIINPGDGDQQAETVAVNIAGGGNVHASRLVRAPLDQLLTARNIGVFQTAARGFRNPYGIAADPFGRIWITDNGATNVGEEYFAGDEVNLFDPAALPANAIGNESATPFYGFPIALSGAWKDWWTPAVLPLLNTSAPTGITWAYGTVFFAQYGRTPGLYRLSVSGGQAIAERVLLGWPIQAVTTAPDGAIWIGTGNGGLYRLTPGCS